MCWTRGSLTLSCGPYRQRIKDRCVLPCIRAKRNVLKSLSKLFDFIDGRDILDRGRRTVKLPDLFSFLPNFVANYLDFGLGFWLWLY